VIFIEILSYWEGNKCEARGMQEVIKLVVFVILNYVKTCNCKVVHIYQ
jgi:hypothetical protein